MSWWERRASVWQAEGGLTAAVLGEVFGWLGGAELARAGAVCRAWRAAAADPALWRRLLLPRVARAPFGGKQTRRALAPLYASQEWRSEYVLAHAGWELRAKLGAGRAALQHAALSPCGSRLAIATEDAAVLIWEQNAEREWHETCSRSVRARGWASVARADWPRGERSRLLLAGPLAVAHRWELIVLQQQEEESEWCVVCRAGCSAGAAGCWAGSDAFLALELRRLAAAHFATTVWLNAATQETQSEYAGVTTPLLRVYNEEKATITHVFVAEVPLDCTEEDFDVTPCDERTMSIGSNTKSSSHLAILKTLICGFSGISGALRSWGLSAVRPPPLLVAGDLRARAAARRAAAAAAAEAEADGEAEPPEPDEAAVRAMCSRHDYECRLPAALVGLVVQPDGRCAWACAADASTTCVSLPALRALRVLQPPAPAPASPLSDLHYVHPAVSDRYFVAPFGAGSGSVCVWGVRSGAPLPAPLPHAAPALAAILPPRRNRRSSADLLVLAADHIYVSRETCATSQDCSTDQDRVALRLSLAERERRRAYEREVCERPSGRGPVPPPSPYTPFTERECARATDGRDYALRCERAPPEPCGPDRAPPPPRCVELVRDIECTVRDAAHVDPCAHVPRTIVEIDRSGARAVSAPPARSPNARNLTSRIMERLSLTRTSSPTGSCPRPLREAKCETTGARRAGDTEWCLTQPKPKPVPPCCREPTTLEKLKRRGPGRCVRDKASAEGKRSFHTSAGDRSAARPADAIKRSADASYTIARSTADAESLKKALKERDTLREAGRGRVVTDKGGTRKVSQVETAGRLDIPVPEGAKNVRIRVSLDGVQNNCNVKCDSKQTTINFSGSGGSTSKTDKNLPWLSLKNIQKKLAGCRKSDSIKVVKENKNDGERSPSTCPRPQPPTPKPPVPRNPCAPSPTKPRDPYSAPPSPKQRDPVAAPTPQKPSNPCATSSPPKPTSACSSPPATPPRGPCSSTPSTPHRPDCPASGKSKTKPTRFSSATVSDYSIAEILFYTC